MATADGLAWIFDVTTGEVLRPRPEVFRDTTYGWRGRISKSKFKTLPKYWTELVSMTLGHKTLRETACSDLSHRRKGTRRRFSLPYSTERPWTLTATR